eukprot:TRINITY_DN21427_c0_g1_i1.p1 TRINITY_DN21427_c0_g1~~TRINITY_DN21427_c0_g1_i1.p1  ORF type:complete len:578 (-),score=166.60 TRINITY_DN21427_c0_g1_i1:58-1791(-)
MVEDLGRPEGRLRSTVSIPDLSVLRGPIETIDEELEVAMTSRNSKFHHSKTTRTQKKLYSFEKIIILITSPDTDQEDILVILTTYRLFCGPSDLLSALSTRILDNANTVIHLRCIIVLRNWIDNHWSDFSKDLSSLMPQFEELSAQWIKKYPKLLKDVFNIFERIEKNSLAKTYLKNVVAFPPPSIEPIKHGKLCLMDMDSLEVARQITLIEHNMYRDVKPWECLGLPWTKTEKDKLAPNLSKTIKWFNTVTYWVQTEVLTEVKNKQRAAKIAKFLEICEHLLNLQNLNGVVEIMSAFGTPSMARLQATINSLPVSISSKITKFNQFISPDNSFKAVREHTAHIIPPCIPYIGSYLAKLKKLEEGNQTCLGGAIHLKKLKLVALTIQELLQFQGYTYPFATVKRIQEYLKSYEAISEESVLYQFSTFVEPSERSEKQKSSPKRDPSPLLRNVTLGESDSELVKGINESSQELLNDLTKKIESYQIQTKIAIQNHHKSQIPKDFVSRAYHEQQIALLKEQLSKLTNNTDNTNTNSPCHANPNNTSPRNTSNTGHNNLKISKNSNNNLKLSKNTNLHPS